MDTITEDGTFTIDDKGVIHNIGQDFAAGFVVALGAITDALSALAPGTMFGRWTDTDGTIYWDRVTILSDLDKALSLARAQHEIAIWDLAEAKEIRC